MSTDTPIEPEVIINLYKGKLAGVAANHRIRVTIHDENGDTDFGLIGPVEDSTTLTRAREAQATLLAAARQARSYMERVENLGQGAIPSVEYQDLDTAIKNVEGESE